MAPAHTILTKNATGLLYRSDAQTSHTSLYCCCAWRAQFVGDTCQLRVLRGGQVVQLDTALSKPTALVPPHIHNRDPSYFIVAGLVFTVGRCDVHMHAVAGAGCVLRSTLRLKGFHVVASRLWPRSSRVTQWRRPQLLPVLPVLLRGMCHVCAPRTHPLG